MVNMKKHFYITTAIDYVNGQPHLGHTYEKVLADVIARYHRLKGESVHFLTGVDEHGQKVQQKAQALGKKPQAFCDEVTESFVALTQALKLTNDDFIRTTDERHKKIVRWALQKLYDQGLIYKAEYKGFYSVKEERFLQEKDKVDGTWPALFGEVKELSESNYFFKLSAYQDWLISYLKENPNFIFPHYRQKQVLEFLKEPLNDLCISRPIDRLQWGIPLPFDPEFVTYVWFDALLNYISAVGFNTESFEHYWPADYHIIGKDILVPSHSIYWPIMLKALELPLPKQIVAHGWWLTSGEKMSKSLGNTFNLFDWFEEKGIDAVRYFLMREMVTGQDCEFSLENFENRYNNELANEWGNLISRTFNMIQRYCDSKVPTQTQSNEDLKAIWEESHEAIDKHFEQFQFSQGLEKLFKFIRELNRYIETKSPWKLAKDPTEASQTELKNVLAHLIEGIRLSVQYLQIIIPVSSQKLMEALQIQNKPSNFSWNPQTLSGISITEKLLLFPKAEKRL